MKLRLILGCYLLFVSSVSIASNPSVYAALADSDYKKITIEIANLLEEKPGSLRNAYLGTLMMKQSSFLPTASEKMKEFKNGKKLLEDEIKAYPELIEYRFLRLLIQENAPPVVKYNNNIREDATLIYKNFNSLNTDLQKEIQRYSRNSDLLDESLLIIE